MRFQLAVSRRGASNDIVVRQKRIANDVNGRAWALLQHALGLPHRCQARDRFHLVVCCARVEARSAKDNFGVAVRARRDNDNRCRGGARVGLSASVVEDCGVARICLSGALRWNNMERVQIDSVDASDNGWVGGCEGDHTLAWGRIVVVDIFNGTFGTIQCNDPGMDGFIDEIRW